MADSNPRIDTYRSRSVDWVLLTGNRGIIALGITALVAAVFTLLMALGAIPWEFTQPLYYAYSGLIAGNLTLVTVIVSINQLFLSRELRTPGELQTQIENIIEYRHGIEQTAGEIAPSEPLDFLRLLVEATRQKAQQVGGFARDGVVTAGHEEIDDVVTTITNQMDTIDASIGEADPDTFDVLSVMLETNYAHQIYRLRMICEDYEDDIDDDAQEAIEELVARLHDIDVSRQYFRSIYLEEELSILSRVLLYAGLPSVVIAIASLAALTIPPDQPETVIHHRVFLPATLTIGLIPLAILCSYFLRAATVTKITAATVPFTTPEDTLL